MEEQQKSSNRWQIQRIYEFLLNLLEILLKDSLTTRGDEREIKN